MLSIENVLNFEIYYETELFDKITKKNNQNICINYMLDRKQSFFLFEEFEDF
jgi:hypothetical protein